MCSNQIIGTAVVAADAYAGGSQQDIASITHE